MALFREGDRVWMLYMGFTRAGQRLVVLRSGTLDCGESPWRITALSATGA